MTGLGPELRRRLESRGGVEPLTTAVAEQGRPWGGLWPRGSGSDGLASQKPTAALTARAFVPPVGLRSATFGNPAPPWPSAGSLRASEPTEKSGASTHLGLGTR